MNFRMVFIAILLFQNLFAQQVYHIDMQYSYGFIIPHRPSIAYYLNRHIQEYRLELSRQLNDSSKWHILYRYPFVGGGLYYTNLQNRTILGEVSACYAFINVPLISRKKIEISYFISAGLAYISKHFDIQYNYYNIAIGSYFNAYINFRWLISFYFNNIHFKSGINFTHYSNGAWNKPNLGFNVPSAFIGLGYHTKPRLISNDNNILKTKEKNEWLFTYSIATRKNYPEDPNRYYVHDVAFDYCISISQKKKIGIGTDTYFDSSIPIREAEIPNYNKKEIYIRSGLRAAYYAIFNKLMMSFQTGAYFYDPLNPDGFIYSKVGVHYKINSFIQSNIILKSHFFKADAIEFGISYIRTNKLNQKK